MSSLYLFSIGDIPVRVSMWYGLLLLFWFRGGDLQSNMIWAAVVTISILVHELGHALVARYYRLRPQILLHGLGGLCAHERADRDLHDVFIVAAGPAAGLVLGGLTLLASVLFADAIATTEYTWIAQVVSMSIWVNIGWSFVNLLPLWPLDGGQLFRLGLIRFFPHKTADRITHWTALVLLAGALFVGWSFGGLIVVILTMWIGWANVQALRGNRSSGPVRTTNKLANDLLKKAKKAYDEEDFEEAARICHQIRREANVADKTMKQLWSILGVSAARLGEHRDALSFLGNAPASVDVTEARIECLYALGRDAELEELLASKDFQAIGKARREEILAVVRSDE
ncbi:MAG: site-2 protease family protein [Myxococcota bacterium]